MSGCEATGAARGEVTPREKQSTKVAERTVCINGSVRYNVQPVHIYARVTVVYAYLHLYLRNLHIKLATCIQQGKLCLC